jgi:hypothetical protein
VIVFISEILKLRYKKCLILFVFILRKNGRKYRERKMEECRNDKIIKYMKFIYIYIGTILFALYNYITWK